MGVKLVEKKNKLLIVGLLGIATLGLIAFSPAIYAAIEPHITITMDPGQTTNPFQIKDDSNNDVFSLRSDGSQSAGVWNNWQYESKLNEVITRTDCTFNDYAFVANGTASVCTLAELKFTLLDSSLAGGNNQYLFLTGMQAMGAEIRRDSGTGTCKVSAMFHDSAGNTYEEPAFGTAIGTGATFGWDSERVEWDSRFDLLGYRVIIDTGDSTTTCSFKNIGYYLTIPDFNWMSYEVTK